MMIYPDRLIANDQYVRLWLAVLLLLFISPMKPVLASEKMIYTVPSRQFLVSMIERGRAPVVREKSRQGQWRRVKHFSRNSVCRLSVDGVFTATGEHNPSAIQWCELVLFGADETLADGWSIQRIHWRGDTARAKFISNPVNTSKMHTRVLLPVPQAGSKNRDLRNRISLRLITLRGPAKRQWVHAINGD